MTLAGAIAGLDTLREFTSISDQMTKLPEISLKPFYDTAIGFYRICQRILKASENISRWLYRFLYFEFEIKSPGDDVFKRFEDLINEYNNEKPLQIMKYKCYEIGTIYEDNIESNLKSLSDKYPAMVKEAQDVFNRLVQSDNTMIDFVNTEIIVQISNFISNVIHIFSTNELAYTDKLNESEEKRLEFKQKSKNVTAQLETLNNDLSYLVIKFADISGEKITINII